jgi:hypothetical protein
VIFVSYGEPNADQNFERLRTLAPRAKRLAQSASLFEGYQGAEQLSATPLFFMVDGDAWIRDGFSFVAPEGAAADIWFWRSINPVNGLTGFTGGLKLLRRRAVRSMPAEAVDPLLSMLGVRRTIREPAGETRFNASPFFAWKAAFRECAKLTGGIVNPPRRAERLMTWQSVGAGKPNGEWCMLGARMGAAFGLEHRDSPAMRRLADNGLLKADFDALAHTLEGGVVTDPSQLLASAALTL